MPEAGKIFEGIPIALGALSINGQADGTPIASLQFQFPYYLVGAYAIPLTNLVKGATVAGQIACKHGSTDIGTVYTLDSTETAGKAIEFSFKKRYVAAGELIQVYLKTAPTGTGGTGVVAGVFVIEPIYTAPTF